MAQPHPPMTTAAHRTAEPQSHSPVRWLDTESSDLVRAFWRAGGGEDTYPRNLERALALALPVTLVKLARLHLHDVDRWLRARNVGLALDDGSRRAVFGCIVAHAGHGFLFVDGADNPDEIRFTIGHEVGHFLADHLLPRKKALELYGERILPVLNGTRAPSETERLSSVLSGIRLDGYRNFLPRSESADGGLDLWHVEGRADRIAAALLAPPERLLPRIVGATFAERTAHAVALLTSEYGMPAVAAIRYAQALLQTNGLGPTWAESLRQRLRP